MIKGTIASSIRIPPFLELYTRLYEERIERFHVFGKKNNLSRHTAWANRENAYITM